MEAMTDITPIDHGRNFLTGARTEGMTEAEFCANLGDNPRRERRDRDNFVFDAAANEEVVIRLAPSGTNHSGTHATLALADRIRNVEFFRVDRSALPNALRARVPAAGRYVISVAEHHSAAEEKGFLGDYCLTFRSGGGAAATLRPTDSVEGAANLPPTADAGADQSVSDADRDGVEILQLDGSKSSDRDGRVVSFEWTEGDKSIAQGTQPRVSFPVGRHDVTLTVTDDDGASDTDSVLITVEENMAQCVLDADCPDDHNACTDTYCTNGQCENVDIAAIECTDHDECTTDTCDPNDGCQHTVLNCNDNDACTTDSCDAAAGCAHAAVTCDDQNACTDDACSPTLGCRHTDNTTACADGDACTVNDHCSGGACAGTPLACNDGLFCNGLESCNNGTCATTGAPCDVNQVCDESGNACVECLTAADCSDGDVCTADTCQNNQCQNSPVSGCCQTIGDCNDGTLCTIDHCTNNVCAYTARNCSDRNACTVDSCSMRTGCVNTPISCDDGNGCTTDSCNRSTGCLNANNALSCDDGDACTTADQCSAGVCGGADIDCDDGLFCSGVETCNDGDCTSSGNPCANGQFCDEVNGCTGTPRPTSLRRAAPTTSSDRPTMSSTATSTGETLTK